MIKEAAIVTGSLALGAVGAFCLAATATKTAAIVGLVLVAFMILAMLGASLKAWKKSENATEYFEKFPKFTLKYLGKMAPLFFIAIVEGFAWRAGENLLSASR